MPIGRIALCSVKGIVKIIEYEKEVTGNGYIDLTDAVINKLLELKAYGGCVQDLTPTPSTPVDIVCNNGAIKVKDDELPVGYKRLLDISTSGGVRYISSIYLTGNDTLSFRFKAAPGNVIGAYNDADANDNYSFYNSTSSVASYARYNGQTGGSSTYTGTEYTVTISPTGVTGVRNPSSFTPTEFTCSIPLCVFATSPTGNVHSDATIYGSAEITGSQNLKLIPCERISDGVIGYYETYNGVFLENQENGTPTTSGYDTSHLTEIYTDGTVEKIGVNRLYDSVDGQGTFVSPSASTSNRIYKTIGKLQAGHYKIKITGDFEFILQYKDTMDGTPTDYGNIGTWTTEEEFDIVDTSLFYGIAIRYPSNSTIRPNDFNGTVSITDANNTVTAEMLLGVGDYVDEQEILSGNITRKVGIKVLDGTEDWSPATTSQGVYRYRFEPADALKLDSGRGHCISTHFFDISGTSTQDIGGVFAATTFLYFIPNQDVNAVGKWTTYLAEQYAAGTPVIIVYPLETPTTETVTGQSLSIPAGDSRIEIVDGSILDLPLYAKYKSTSE